MALTTAAMTDHELKMAVAAELDWAPEVSADQVGIAVNQGTVILSGEVATYLEKRAAVNAALRVRGVTAVADEIAVEHEFGRRDDVDIARDAAAAIRADVALVDADLQVTVEDGRVSLTGSVPWNYQRAAAERTVSRIRGVSAVYNRVTLRPTRPFAAGEARKRILEAFERTTEADAQSIAVDVEGTEIVLSGSVRTPTESARAEQVAWSTPGVTEVRNELLISS
jgi:osmotically-inducible protein OsmY